MYIFEIIKPGSCLQSNDRDWSWEVDGILRNLESQFYEANLALNMFLNAASQARGTSRDQEEVDDNRKSVILKELESKLADPYDRNNWEDLRIQTDIIFKREQWLSGRLPREFQHNQVFMHARAFLYALDSFDKFMNVLSLQKNIPEIIPDLYNKFRITFPQLRSVRNTAQHMEDRSRGLGAGKNPKPLDLKPVNNSMIKANGGALILNSLNGTMYGNTMADGHYGEVDVSLLSMESLASIFQELLNCFKWKGLKIHLPSL